VRLGTPRYQKSMSPATKIYESAVGAHAGSVRATIETGFASWKLTANLSPGRFEFRRWLETFTAAMPEIYVSVLGLNCPAHLITGRREESRIYVNTTRPKTR